MLGRYREAIEQNLKTMISSVLVSNRMFRIVFIIYVHVARSTTLFVPTVCQKTRLVQLSNEPIILLHITHRIYVQILKKLLEDK